jgi:hypothetical protein
MNACPAITADNVREIFGYDDVTGSLTWRGAYGPSRPGMTAGSYDPKGYRILRLQGRQSYGIARLVWLWHHGAWPEGVIAYRDNNKMNTRIGNLSDVTRASTQLTAECYSEFGVKGVNPVGDHFRARINDHRIGKVLHLGTFETADGAARAFKGAHVEIHGIDSQHFDEYHKPHPALREYARKFLEDRQK